MQANQGEVIMIANTQGAHVSVHAHAQALTFPSATPAQHQEPVWPKLLVQRQSTVQAHPLTTRMMYEMRSARSLHPMLPGAAITT